MIVASLAGKASCFLGRGWGEEQKKVPDTLFARLGGNAASRARGLTVLQEVLVSLSPVHETSRDAGIAFLGRDFVEPNAQITSEDQRAAFMFMFLPSGNSGQVRLADNFVDDIVRRGNVSVPRTTGSFDTIPAGQRLQTYYPSNRGFFGESTRQTLVPGSVIDRYGREGGTFVAPQGTPFGARALPSSSSNAPYNQYRIVKPIEVDGGTTAPWFGQPGLGTQYELPSSVSDLLKSGHLERVTP